MREPDPEVWANELKWRAAVRRRRLLGGLFVVALYGCVWAVYQAFGTIPALTLLFAGIVLNLVRHHGSC